MTFSKAVKALLVLDGTKTHCDSFGTESTTFSVKKCKSWVSSYSVFKFDSNCIFFRFITHAISMLLHYFHLQMITDVGSLVVVVIHEM